MLRVFDTPTPEGAGQLGLPGRAGHRIPPSGARGGSGASPRIPGGVAGNRGGAGGKQYSIAHLRQPLLDGAAHGAESTEGGAGYGTGAEISASGAAGGGHYAVGSGVGVAVDDEGVLESEGAGGVGVSTNYDHDDDDAHGDRDSSHG